MPTSIETGFAAGVAGFATGIYVLVAFRIFDVFDAPFGWYLIIGFIVFLEFIAGIAEAYLEGVGYSLGLLIAGGILDDYGSLFAGFLGLVGHIIGILIRAGLIDW